MPNRADDFEQLRAARSQNGEKGHIQKSYLSFKMCELLLYYFKSNNNTNLKSPIMLVFNGQKWVKER
jgi:hypothetical protein